MVMEEANNGHLNSCVSHLIRILVASKTYMAYSHLKGLLPAFRGSSGIESEKS
jgi:hypothetical protein